MWQTILERQREWTLDEPTRVRLSAEEAVVLYRDAPLQDLMSAGLHRRKLQIPGDEVTYLVDRNVNYTNACTINCQFCSFYRPVGHEEVYTQTVDQISKRLAELEAAGGCRVLMQGGVNPDLPFEWYLDLIQELRLRHPTIDLDCFSPIEIQGMAEVSGRSTLEVLHDLKTAGMHGLPGGGAEMLVEGVRRDVSPKKGGPEQWVRIMAEAQDLHLVTSATNVIGFGEGPEERIEHLIRVREMQDRALREGALPFTSFIAWPVQLEVNSFGRRNKGRNRTELGAGPSEYLRHVAVSRLVLDVVDHVQASWPTMGLQVAQMALLAGADDAGSTMMEENVVSASGTTKVEASEAELQRAIHRAGWKPRRRNSRYELLDTPEQKEPACPSPVPVHS